MTSFKFNGKSNNEKQRAMQRKSFVSNWIATMNHSVRNLRT